MSSVKDTHFLASLGEEVVSDMALLTQGPSSSRGKLSGGRSDLLARLTKGELHRKKKKDVWRSKYMALHLSWERIRP